MSAFGNDLIKAMTEALAHSKGAGPIIQRDPVTIADGHETVSCRRLPSSGVVLANGVIFCPDWLTMG